MFLRPGLLVVLEGDWHIYTAEPVRGRRDVIKVGPHVYDQQFKAVSPAAPDVLEAVDIDSGFKDHRKGRDATIARWKKQEQEGREREAREREAREKLLASAEGWKHDRPLKAFPRTRFLKVTCINPRCGRVRYDQIGHICDEGRLGERTVFEVQQAFYCVGCRDEVRLDLN